MNADLAPLFALRVRTPRLELRLPTRAELVALYEVAEAGIHPPDEMPFGVAWTDDLALDSFVSYHEAALDTWTPDRWDCNFVTFLHGHAIGTQALHGREFGRTREVGTGSWLGAPYQRRGFGTEQRAAVLELAFRGLGAQAATSGAQVSNAASRSVSERLGYRVTHEDTISPRGEPVRHLHYRLEAAEWRSPYAVDIVGLEPCLPLFGVT